MTSGMTTDEMRVNFTYLINRYVTDQATKDRLLEHVERSEVPAKGILAELTPFLSGEITGADGKIIRDLVFYFC